MHAGNVNFRIRQKFSTEFSRLKHRRNDISKLKQIIETWRWWNSSKKYLVQGSSEALQCEYLVWTFQRKFEANKWIERTSLNPLNATIFNRLVGFSILALSSIITTTEFVFFVYWFSIWNGDGLTWKLGKFLIRTCVRAGNSSFKVLSIVKTNGYAKMKLWLLIGILMVKKMI